jgi:hypothetical protein
MRHSDAFKRFALRAHRAIHAGYPAVAVNSDADVTYEEWGRLNESGIRTWPVTHTEGGLRCVVFTVAEPDPTPDDPARVSRRVYKVQEQNPHKPGSMYARLAQKGFKISWIFREGAYDAGNGIIEPPGSRAVYTSRIHDECHRLADRAVAYRSA